MPVRVRNVEMRAQAEGGTSLLESLVALFVLASGVLLLASVQLSLLAQLSDSEKQMQALILAHNQAECLVIADCVSVSSPTASGFELSVVPEGRGHRIDIRWQSPSWVHVLEDGSWSLRGLP